MGIVNNTKPSFEVRKRKIEKLDRFDCKITFRADMSSYDVGHEISLLRAHILRLAGKSESDVGGGGVNVTFKQLFDDDAVANSLESLAGTLKAAKKKKLVDYGPELLLQGATDDAVITLKQLP